MVFFLFLGVLVLLYLVFNARNRLNSLEDDIGRLRDALQSLQRQAAARPETDAPLATQDARPEEAPERHPAAAPEENLEIVDDRWLAEESAFPATEQPADSLAAWQFDYSPTAAELTAAGAAEPEPLGEPAFAEGTDEPPGKAEERGRRIELPEPPDWLTKAKEWLFGGNLVAKVGLLILFIGVAFLLKFAAARFSAPIELRIAGIVLADIALLLWGWRIRESRPAIGLPVQGGAIGILMLVTFAAFRLYDLIPGAMAFGLLFFLTLLTCILAVLQNAIWLAIFGIVGGFAAPILTSTGHGSHVGLFSYYALLNAGILAIALKRPWRLLNLLGFIFTFAIGTTWGVLRYEPEFYVSVQAFLILFFVFYVAIAILFAQRQSTQLKYYVDGTLVFGTPLAAFGLQYGIIHDTPFGLAFSALALGVFYIAAALLLWRQRGGALKLLVESFLALGVVFGTLAVPLAFDGRWTSTAWALEGAGVVWAGLRQKRVLAWSFGILVQVGAWAAFVASLFGLTVDSAIQANLWLGFLLLAVTGFLMALCFRNETAVRRREDDADSQETSPSIAGLPVSSLMTALATAFLGSAALWLLAGAWSEIFLRSGIWMPTLLALSAIAVAAILLLIANRLDWPISRYFALAPQFLAGILFLAILFKTDLPSLFTSANLIDTNFFAPLLITLGAAVSGLSFRRQEEQHGQARMLSHCLLGWTAFWWLACTLVILSLWGSSLLGRHGVLSEQSLASPLRPLYCLLLAASTPLIARLSKRLRWPEMHWLAAVVWPGLLFAMAMLFSSMLEEGSPLPQPLDCAAVLALWLTGEWLLREGERENWLTPEHPPYLLRALHTLRTAGPWLILWLLVHNLVEHWLNADALAQSADYSGEWFVPGRWSRYLSTWAMMGFVALLIPRARAGLWPTRPIAGWYRNVLIPIGAACALILAVCWNFSQNGRMEPLPYLPLLNPLDLTTGFATLLSIAAWRLRGQTLDREWQPRLLAAAWGAAYVWFNLMLLRTAAYFLDIPYQIEPLFRSQFIQAMLSLVWSASALVLMRFAAQRLQRMPWMVGAGLLALVVAKLFLVDLSNVGGIERIVSFLGVGALMLAIGYLAPFPSGKTKPSE